MVDGLRRTIGRILGTSYGHVLDEISDLSNLQPGWNGYRAGEISKDAQKRAADFVQLLTNIPGHVPAPSVVPTSNGGVALRWLTADREVEIIFLADGGEYTVGKRGSEDVLDSGGLGRVDLLKQVVAEHLVGTK